MGKEAAFLCSCVMAEQNVQFLQNCKNNCSRCKENVRRCIYTVLQLSMERV